MPKIAKFDVQKREISEVSSERQSILNEKIDKIGALEKKLVKYQQ